MYRVAHLPVEKLMLTSQARDIRLNTTLILESTKCGPGAEGPPCICTGERCGVAKIVKVIIEGNSYSMFIYLCNSSGRLHAQKEHSKVR